ncbi:hypothetical protein BH11MYX1_BH11MYX1_39300 [soil metagenome]
MKCLYRRDYVAADLMRAHPPVLRDKNKQLVHELAMAGPAPVGAVTVTRWDAAPVATQLAATEVIPLPGYYDYAGGSAGVWHVNFADPALFVAYGSQQLAQDELQCCEHPALGSIREALGAEELVARTEDNGRPTPILISGVERRCTLETAPDLEAGRPYGLYGNRFGVADAKTIRTAVRVHRPPATSNLIAIAAPVGRGEYTRAQIDHIVSTAFTGFAAAVVEAARIWPGTPCEVRTGFWGCGAFGGNRELMTMLQILAARLAGVTRLKFYAFDDAGRADFEAGARALATVIAANDPELSMLLERIADLDHAWGSSNGT